MLEASNQYLSAKGAKCNSLGQRPRLNGNKLKSAESARSIPRLQRFQNPYDYPPRALPWAIAFRAFGAEEISRFDERNRWQWLHR